MLSTTCREYFSSMIPDHRHCAGLEGNDLAFSFRVKGHGKVTLVFHPELLIELLLELFGLAPEPRPASLLPVDFFKYVCDKILSHVHIALDFCHGDRRPGQACRRSDITASDESFHPWLYSPDFDFISYETNPEPVRSDFSIQPRAASTLLKSLLNSLISPVQFTYSVSNIKNRGVESALP